MILHAPIRAPPSTIIFGRLFQLLFFDTTFQPASQDIFIGKRIRTSPEALDFTGVSRLVLIIGYWHTFATNALAYGMDIKTLSTILGHVSCATTLNTYSHVTDEMRQRAAVKDRPGHRQGGSQTAGGEAQGAHHDHLPGEETVEPKGKLNDVNRPAGRKIPRRAGFRCLWANMWSRGA